MRRVACGALVVLSLVTAGMPASRADDAVRRNIVPRAAIDVEGSVVHVRLDDAGHRMAVSTVRYPEGGLRRDEVFLYELSGPEQVAQSLRLDVADAIALALSSDGEQVAVACRAGVCVHDWATMASRLELAARATPRDVGALAFRPDAKLVVAAQRRRMEILTWEGGGDRPRSWVSAALGERARESITPRLHGGPPWIPRWVGISPDATRVAATRDDGTTFLWRRTGETLASVKLSYYADIDPAFAPDGSLLGVRAGNGRLEIVDVERDRGVLTLDDGDGRSPRRAALLPGAGTPYLAVSRPEGVVLHAVPSGRVVAVIPVADRVWRIAMNARADLVAVATQHRVMLWRVVDR